MVVSLLFASSIAASQAAGPNLTLDLVCQGQASISTSETTNIGPVGGPVNFATTEGRARVQERVEISFNDSRSRIRLPSSMLPSIRGRSDDGWRAMSNIVISDDLITGRVSFNFLDKPSIRIDRITGTVEIRGLDTSFVGDCRPIDISERRF